MASCLMGFVVQELGDHGVGVGVGAGVGTAAAAGADL